MKKMFIPIVFIAFATCTQAQTSEPTEINGCTVTAYHGNETTQFEAYGNVYVLTDKDKERADMRVRVVNSPKYATYKVFRCTDKPNKCGEWRFVTDRREAKFTIRFVYDDFWQDCTIYYTDDRKNAGYF
jgi:hypothetical protein